MDVQLTPTIRYWEMEAQKIALLLQELKHSGAQSLGAWVPWSHLENDSTQALRRFIKQAVQFGLKVRLCVTPEVSVGYVNGGIPHDLLRRSENLARDRSGQTIYACAPPNIHPLVNLNAPQVFQRYGHFLLKLSQEIAEMVQEDFAANIELIVGDSFYKHYTTLGLPEEDHGDFSSLFFQRELDFMQGWTPAQAERAFCARARDFLQARFPRSLEVKTISRNFFMRSASLDRLLDEMSGAVIDYESQFHDMQMARSRCDAVWFNDFGSALGKERSFLVSSALALYGDVWLPAEEYFSLSAPFRRKMAGLCESLSGEAVTYERPVLAIVQNRFAPARLAQSMQKRLRHTLQMRSSLFELSPQEYRRIRVMVVEEALVIDYDQFHALVERAKAESVTIALFRSSLCKRAQAEVNCFEKFRFSHGWNYEVTLFPSGGHILVIDGHESSTASMDVLAERILSVGNIESWCEYSDPQIASISLWTSEDQKNRILFFLNPSVDARATVLRFNRAFTFEGMQFSNREGRPRSESFAGESLDTTLPAQSVVPLQVSWSEPEQKQIEHTAAGEMSGSSEELVQI